MPQGPGGRPGRVASAGPGRLSARARRAVPPPERPPQALIGEANEREQELYAEHASPGRMLEDPSMPDGDIWSGHLTSKGEDVLLGRILSSVFQSVGEGLVHHNLKSQGLKKKQRLERTERENFVYVYTRAAQLLAINPIPDVYAPGGRDIRIAETFPPVLVIGDNVRQGHTHQELAFVVGKALTYFHPLRQPAVMGAPSLLTALVNAAIKLFYADHEVGALEKDEGFTSVLAALRELPAHGRQALGKYVEAFMRQGGQVNIARWLNQIELSANHAGLLMCNDIVVAGRLIKAESHRALFTAPSRLGTRDKLVDLATYALSDDYLSLRRKLGVTIG